MERQKIVSFVSWLLLIVYHPFCGGMPTVVPEEVSFVTPALLLFLVWYCASPFRDGTPGALWK